MPTRKLWICTLGILVLTGCGASASPDPLEQGSGGNRLSANQSTQTQTEGQNSVSQSRTSDGSMPDLVQVVQKNPLHQKVPSVDATISDGKTVALLYRDLSGLSKPQAGIRSCPADWGVTYHLTFKRKGKMVDTAVVDPSGCRMISWNGLGREGESPQGAKFFTDLALALNVPEAELSGAPNTPGAPAREPLRQNPTKLVIVKNGVSHTITNQKQLNQLVALFNQSEQTKPGAVSCMAMTKDVFQFTFVYPDFERRAFENRGGACQPMIDMKTGHRFPAGKILGSALLGAM